MLKIRCIKFVVDKVPQELLSYRDTHFGCMNEINQELMRFAQKGFVFEQRFKGYYVTTPTGVTMTDAEFCTQYLLPIYQKWCTKKAKATFNGMYNLVARQYRGYEVRNDGSTKLIHLKKKTISLKNAELSLSNGKIQVHNVFGNDFTLDFGNFGCVKNSTHMPKKVGGNITIKDGGRRPCIIVQVKIPYTFAYTPITYLAIDINKSNKHWLYLNDGTVIVKPAELIRLEDAITTLNKQIKDPALNTKQRKRRRLRWHRLHRKHNKFIEKIVDQILDRAEQQKSLLIIDTVKTGQANGTFGQDKLFFLFTKKAEDRCIPFVVTPCAYTSQRCTKCGHIDPKNRKEDKFLCTKCGHTCHADHNGALNLEEFAKVLYSHNILGLLDKKELQRARDILKQKFHFPK